MIIFPEEKRFISCSLEQVFFLNPVMYIITVHSCAVKIKLLYFFDYCVQI